MAYDEKADVMVMFGGVTGYQIDYDKWMADTWTYDLNTNTWTNMSPASNPPPRAYASMAYDNKSDVIVMFGGWQGYWGNTYHDTWIYNLTSNTWANVTTSIHPGGMLFGSMMYDYGNGRILLGGGTNWDIPLNDIWEFNFTTNSWTELIPSTSVPTFATALTYDIESNIIVANGGPTDAAEEVFVQETWKFNLTSGQWNNSYSPNNPPPRSRHYLAYDIESDRTIMYGGALPNGAVGEALGDTWSYDHRVNPPLLAPDHVNNLRVIPGPTNDALIITWEVPDPIAGVTIIGYNVYRGSESGVYELLVELGDVHTYTDLTVGFGITYYYVVTAVATTGESDFPDEVSESLDLVPYDDGVHTFIAYGDTRASDSTAVAAIHDDLVSRYLQLSDPEMIIHTGDMVYHGGEVEQFPLFNDSISAIWEWDPNMKFYGAVGNHEWYTDAGPIDEDFSNYIDLFDSIYANAIDEPGETELWYSYDWQGIHFIFLNTIEGWDGEEFTCPTEQMTWLMNDLAGNHEFIIVSMHNPCYSIRADRPDRWAQAAAVNNTFHDIFVDNGVDIVFTGHDHQYYRTVRDDIHFIVTGGGGAPLYDVDTEGPVWQEGDFGFSDYHYCVCELNPLNETHNRLTVEVVLMDGTVMDTFHEDLLKPPVTTTTTTGTATQPPFPWVLTLVVTGAAVAVIVVLVLIMRKRK
jgi:predicted phosphodiesterase